MGKASKEARRIISTTIERWLQKTRSFALSFRLPFFRKKEPSELPHPNTVRAILLYLRKRVRIGTQRARKKASLMIEKLGQVAYHVSSRYRKSLPSFALPLCSLKKTSSLFPWRPPYCTSTSRWSPARWWFKAKRKFFYDHEQAQLSYSIRDVFFHTFLILWERWCVRKTQKDTEARLEISPPLFQDDGNVSSLHWVGHSTEWILISPKEGRRDLFVLTDPILGDLVPHFSPRTLPPPIQPDEMPPIDVILITHNHPDHLHFSTLKHLLLQQPHVVVPAGIDSMRLRSFGFQHVHEMQWGDHIEIEKEDSLVHLEASPCNHLTGRWLIDQSLSNVNSYLLSWIEKGDTLHKLYFSGDTARMKKEDIDQLRDRLFLEGQRVTLIFPGGADEIRAHMRYHHQSTADVIMLFLQLIENIVDTISWKERLKGVLCTFNHEQTFTLSSLDEGGVQTTLERFRAMMDILSISSQHEVSSLFDRLPKDEADGSWGLLKCMSYILHRHKQKKILIKSIEEIYSIPHHEQWVLRELIEWTQQRSCISFAHIRYILDHHILVRSPGSEHPA